MRAGKLGLQVFTTVTHQPACFTTGCKPFPNFVGLKHVYGFSPVSTWFSLSERALWQAEKLHRFARADDNFRIVKTRRDLENFLTDRRSNPDLVAGLLGVEGLHALEGEPKNVTAFFTAGFRLFGLSHWIDKRLRRLPAWREGPWPDAQGPRPDPRHGPERHGHRPRPCLRRHRPDRGG